MSLTIKFLLKCLVNMIIFVNICAFCYLQYYLVIDYNRCETTMQFLNKNYNTLLIVLECALIGFGCIIYCTEGYNIIVWNKINMFCINNIDPTFVKICNFVNRKNGGCKE